MSWLGRCVVLSTIACAGCGSEYADPIRGPADDACAHWTTETACTSDTANGCSFEPNLVGCHSGDPGCPSGLCRGGDPFVRRTGRTLWLHDAPYSFVGSVSWGIAWDPDGCRVTSLADQNRALARTFDDLSDVCASALKIWAFQSFAGAAGTDYSSFDRVVAAARRAGVRLIFVLENEWADCTSGTRDDAWFASGFQSPYGSYTLSFVDYVRGLVEHFANEPTVLAWEIMHEAHGNDFTALDGFAGQISSLIRASDTHHLIVLGLDNGDSPATSSTGSPSNYELLYAHPAIDLLDVHDFNDEATPLSARAVELGAIADTLGKPVFAGASAVALRDATADGFSLRAQEVDHKLNAAFVAGFAGFLVYDYYPDWSTPGPEFDMRAEDPLAGASGVLARHSCRSR